MRIENFGRNVRYVPRTHYAPRAEEEVLEILDRHADGRVRAFGSLHSWSDVPVSEDVALDLRRLDSVDVAAGEEGELAVEVGGGCRLKRLLDLLRLQADATLPTLGAVTEQTVAGAVATATHGSGAASLSHLVQKVRAAAYDPGTGRARTYEWTGGPELRAARCALGCLGVVLSLRLPAVPRFHMEEVMVRCETIEETLAGVADYPLQQIIWLPWDWRFYPYRRRVVPGPPEGGGRAEAYARRGFNWLGVDVGLHLALEGLVRWGSPAAIRRFFREALPAALVLDRPVVDDSRHILTLNHQYFRHLEMELFVPESRLPEALEVVREVLAVFAGEAERPSDAVAARLREAGTLEAVLDRRGSYTHHYPISIRRVLPDDTLISMTAGADEPRHAVSFFTYQRGSRRDFYEMAGTLARTLLRLHGARPHWGKYFPLTHEEIAPLVPGLPEFREVCRSVDPRGVFRNAYTSRVLGFGG